MLEGSPRYLTDETRALQALLSLEPRNMPLCIETLSSSTFHTSKEIQTVVLNNVTVLIALDTQPERDGYTISCWSKKTHLQNIVLEEFLETWA